MRLVIIWFRNDLRIVDNLVIHKCLDLITTKQIDAVLPFYCFDRDIFEGVSREAKLPRCSAFRRNFMIECVQDLIASLKSRLDSCLYTAYGQPELELTKLIDRIHAVDSGRFVVDQVLTTREVANEEVL